MPAQPLLKRGYGDWGRQKVWQAEPHVDEAVLSINANRTFGPFDVSAWQAATFAIVPGAGFVPTRVQFDWYLDETLTRKTGTSMYDVIASTECTDLWEHQGPWMTVSVFPSIPASGGVIDLIVTPSDSSTRHIRRLNHGIVLSVTGLVVPPGGSTSVNSSVIAGGRAVFAASAPGSTDWDAILTGTDYNLIDYIVGTLNGGHNLMGDQAEVALPQLGLFCQLTNHGGIDAVFDVSVILSD